jgi:hypothetical protein
VYVSFNGNAGTGINIETTLWNSYFTMEEDFLTLIGSPSRIASSSLFR